ncbi:MurR/RpiR family transcriptional regulator, partial [Ruegeria sp.]|uniref:MurR/RpiR family transcriptional regulator n=1 Tax=Ruegeria sp. TaxID=1879320 RepID=UPI002316C133
MAATLSRDRLDVRCGKIKLTFGELLIQHRGELSQKKDTWMRSQIDQDDEEQLSIQTAQRTPAVLDLISVLRRTNGEFAPREQRVADFVMENLEAVSQMVIADLAEACNVSTPTVIRFCRTLGCDGYRDFKIKLARNVAVSMQYLAPSQESSAPRDNSPVDLVVGALNSALEKTRAQLDPDAF